MENLIPFLITIGVLIVVHEFGHFIVAKWCGVGVLRFAIGFGPAIFKKRIGETEYRLCPIPLGGYVRMVGDMPDMITGEQETDAEVRGEATEEYGENLPPEVERMIKDKSRWFIEKSLWQRTAIVAAGPIFNFLFSLIAVALSLAYFGENVPLNEPRIGDVSVGAPAKEAGLLPGDVILSVDGASIASWDQLAESINASQGKEVRLEVSRAAEIFFLPIVPQEKEINLGPDGKSKRFLIGISPASKHEQVSIFTAAKASLQWNYMVTSKTIEGLWGMIAGHVSPKELAGPVFIYHAAGEQSRKGVESLLYFMALLSVSLAVLNLLPVPVLDGGHLLFFFLEAIFGPIKTSRKEAAQMVGMFLLIGMMVFAVTNDIMREKPAKPDPIVQWEDKPADTQSVAP